MDPRVRTKGTVQVLDLEGKITIGREDLLLRQTFQRLLGEGKARFVLNLTKVEYVDSSGLGEIVACKKRALDRGGDVKLLAPAPRVFELLQLSRLTQVFEVFQEEAPAVDSFGEPARKPGQ
ncbi:MAG: STAS domain-containing protein [Acidobacteria bacterium]|nr:STAS domain-containing protein [Acidobacteriota bacterium]